MEDGKLTVRAVERALEILLCFREASDLSLTEIAAKTGLHKSTAHRLLASLEAKGFVSRRRETDKYRIGFSVWELAAQLAQSDDPSALLLAEMERLRDQVGETVSLYIRDGMERVRIQSVQSNQEIRRVAPIGARLPLYVGASSKVLVAFAEPEVQDAVLSAAGWPSDSVRELFRKQLEETRMLGYATSTEEREAGAAAVAAPVFDRNRHLVAALAISGPSNRLTPGKMREYAPVLMMYADRMGKMWR